MKKAPTLSVEASVIYRCFAELSQWRVRRIPHRPRFRAIAAFGDEAFQVRAAGDHLPGSVVLVFVKYRPASRAQRGVNFFDQNLRSRDEGRYPAAPFLLHTFYRMETALPGCIVIGGFSGMS